MAKHRHGRRKVGSRAFLRGSIRAIHEAKAKQKKTIAKSAKAGRFVLGSAGFGKISAVEGIRMTPAMKKRAGDALAKKLTAEEYRRMIIRSYRKG